MAITLFKSLLLALLLVSPLRAGAEGVTVFAAASLKTALDEVADAFEARGGAPVTVSYAGSSALARQIERGAPADLFISANPEWMDMLDVQGLIAPGSRRDVLGNRLVLISTRPLTGDIKAVIGGNRLALAMVDAVPAGLYAKAALMHLGLWDQVRPNVVQTDNVRAALALVALGEVPFGIVYATDAQAEPRVHVVDLLPRAAHPPILYPAARVTGRDNADADALLNYLSGPDAQAIFAEHGFLRP